MYSYLLKSTHVYVYYRPSTEWIVNLKKYVFTQKKKRLVLENNNNNKLVVFIYVPLDDQVQFVTNLMHPIQTNALWRSCT